MAHIIYLVDSQLQGLLVPALQAWPGCRQLTRVPLGELASCHCDKDTLLVIESANWNPDFMHRLKKRLSESDTASIVICRHASDDDARQAIESGVTTFITGKLEGERLAPVISTALARHQRDHQLLKALATARRQLTDRQDIEKAKGVLMQTQQLSEADAYQKLRREAMQRQQRLGDLARQILAMQSLL